MPPLKAGDGMVNKVKNTMLSHNMFPTRSVLVGLSGGADSVALLFAMHKLSSECGFSLYAAHVNHGLRGETAKRDEDFSKALCDRLGIECFVKNADVRSVAKELGVSEEMAGRKVRYDFFAELMDTHNIEYTATAHHKNDNAETILMNIMRGSATGGLCGIPYRRDRYIRPLLDVTRRETEKFCAENGLEFVTDETNLKTVYTRNKIRNVLIPEIETQFNPNFVDTITANASIIRDDENFLDTISESEYKRIVNDNSVYCDDITALHKAIARRVIRKMIDGVCTTTDIPSTIVEAVYDLCKKGRTGLVCNITKSVSARTEYGKLVIDYTQRDCDDFSYDIKIGESVYIPELGYTLSAEYADRRENDGWEYFSIPDCENTICVTNRHSGDRFMPSGMNGTKSVKDYMINEKIPKNQRSRTGILRIGGEIAWIIGYRRDERFKFRKNGIKIRVLY